MTARCFVDTNILVYAASTKSGDREKTKKALAVLARGDIGFSAQVIQEFYVVATGKQYLQIPGKNVSAIIDILSDYPIVPITKELVLAAIELKNRRQISYWDAAILAAAHVGGAEVLFSEDLGHGQVYDGVLVQNPFL